jgi:hypothetical protein
MRAERLATLSQHMATVTLVLMIAMLSLNALNWIYPPFGVNDYGITFGLTERSTLNSVVDIAAMPWWQTLGAIAISSIPLLVLLGGLQNLRALFRTYAGGAYFSVDAARLLGKMGRAIALWVVAEFLTEPFLSMWTTMLAGDGKRLVTLSIDGTAFVALFSAGCIIVIARILGRASQVYEENRTFV